MVNEIKGPAQSVAQSLVTKQQTDKKAVDQSSDNSTNPSANSDVTLTDTSARLSKLENQISTQPVVDAQRVEKIRQSIAEGSFQVNSARTADKMAEFESLLSNKSGNK